jgi:hypothetical protein
MKAPLPAWRTWTLLSALVVGPPAAAATPQGVPFTEVAFADTFWAPRIETNRVATIPHLLSQLERQGSLGGFRILAGNRSEPYRGYMWGDSDVYKTLEGMTAAGRLRPDPALAQRAEPILRSIVAAQTADGYLFPHLQLTEPGYRRFSEETSRTCESYSMGHLIEAAVEHHRLTGNTNFLAVACRAAELLRRTHAGGELFRLSGHPEVELALVKLYEATGDRRWLELAASLIANARHLPTAWSQGPPPLAGDEARGHAVAMLYLYAAATDVARLRGDAELAGLLRRKWTNLVERKLYLTGGLGHSRHSEGLGGDYDLPNDLAYAETCAAIANVFWQHRLYLASGDPTYLDVLERSLYNNVLAGIASSGDRFFYVNPLEADGRRGFNQGQADRFAWTGCPCCPVNLVRFIPRVGDYFYAVQADRVFVNLFASGLARLRLPAGELVLRQHTRYPWDGRVQVEIVSAPAQVVRLHFRIPGWARGRPLPGDLYRYADPTVAPVTLRLNGESVPFTDQDGYAALPRIWQTGDELELNLPMPARRVLAHERVGPDRGCVAVERGPLVYCVEGVDHGGAALNLVLPDAATLTPGRRADWLGGLTVIEAAGQRVVADNVRSTEPAHLTFVPYYAWNHRGAGEMAVWLPRTPERESAPKPRPPAPR